MSAVSRPKTRLRDRVAKSDNTIYQAATDGFVTAYALVDGAARILADNFTPPTTQANYGYCSAVRRGGTSAYIKKGDYWKTESVDTVYWSPVA